MLQKRQLRVQVAPRIKKVAVRAEKHSNWLGQLASWHTVWSWPLPIMERICSYSGPEGSFLLSQEGLPVRMEVDGGMVRFFPIVKRKLETDFVFQRHMFIFLFGQENEPKEAARVTG
jgi:hypothetical protein